MMALLCVVACCSGAAALLFESVWFYQAGLAFGNSVWASSVVLTGFMAGLGAGNLWVARLGERLRRPLRVYAGLELAIGAAGLLVVWCLPQLTPRLATLFSPLLDRPLPLNLLRLTLALGFLIVPAAAMGATLPLLVRTLTGRDPRFGPALGRLYGWNTVGAVLGAVAPEAGLVQWAGIYGTAWAAVACNGTAALIALALSQRLDPLPVSTAESWRWLRWPQPVTRLLLAAALSGGIMLALEVVWFRLLLLCVTSQSAAFALMLAVVLAGIAAGGLIASRWLSRDADADQHLPLIALVTGIAVLLSYAAVPALLPLLRGRIATRWHEIALLGAALMGPVSMCSGALFPILGRALHRHLSGANASTALLTCANTLGAAAGSLAGGFLLIPSLGVERSLVVLAALYGVLAFLALPESRAAGGRIPIRRLGVAAAGLVLAACAVLPAGLMRRTFLQHPINRFVKQEREQLIAVREGLTETVLILERRTFDAPIYHRLITNSYSMTGTMAHAQRYMKLFAYLPAALHPAPRRALLISYGVGSTAGALTNIPSLEAIDVVDVSRDIVEMSRLLYPQRADDPLSDPRVRVHIEDGRFFLQTTRERFDLITAEPPPPKAAGIVSLYTLEYFRLVRERLADGGMVTYWFPAHSLSLDDGRAILGAFCGAFPDCSLWQGAGLDWLMLGTRDAQGPVSEEQFVRLWRDPAAAADLQSIALDVPQQLGALFLADAAQLRPLLQDAAPLTDAYPKRLTPGFPPLAQAKAAYQPWMGAQRIREQFLHSAFIEQVWPTALRAASAPYVAPEAAIHAFLLGDLRTMASRLPAVHHILAELPLRTAVLWLLDSSVAEQQAAAAAHAAGGVGAGLEYQFAVRAFADRDNALAERHLRQAIEQGAAGRKYTHLRIYALCRQGRLDEARRLITESGIPSPEHPGDAVLLRFLADTFGLAP